MSGKLTREWQIAVNVFTDKWLAVSFLKHFGVVLAVLIAATFVPGVGDTVGELWFFIFMQLISVQGTLLLAGIIIAIYCIFLAIVFFITQKGYYSVEYNLGANALRFVRTTRIKTTERRIPWRLIKKIKVKRKYCAIVLKYGFYHYLVRCNEDNFETVAAFLQQKFQ